MENILAFPLSFSFWLAFLYVIVRLGRFSIRSLPEKHYPPGPRCFPIIGNLHHFASDQPFLQFTELAKKYGDIVGLKAGPGNLVILNSAKIVTELIEKRSAIYSGRPCGYVPREHIVRGARQVVFLKNDDYLRQWRTAARYILGTTGTENVLPIQEATTAELMLKLAEDPTRFLERFQSWALLVPLRIICGDRTARKDTKIQQWFFDNQQKWLELLTPGRAPPVDIFPIMKYVPEFLSGWKKTARSLRETQIGFYYMMLDTAKREAAGNSNASGIESLMAKILREQQHGGKEDEKFNDEDLAYMGGGLLDAATDTTYSTALIFVMVFAAYPHVLKRAQAEVDVLSGSEHPPRGEDIGKLPFLKACHLEVLRWRPVTPLGLPHQLDADDTVGGYHLEKGTVILQNTWAINHDPESFENPETFNPDRFLANPYGTKMSADEVRAAGRKQTYIFGVGRRRCPGDLFAQNSILLTMAKLAWAFDVVPTGPIDTTIETGFHAGLVIGPEGLKVGFVPRSDKRRQAVFDDFQRLSHILE